MLPDSGIKTQVQEEICQLAAQHQLHQVILFGSRARGDYHRASDIDLAVSGGDITRFALDVDQETSTLLHYDVIDLDQDIPTALREAIQTEGRVLYEKI